MTLEQQLSAAQARILELREALEEIGNTACGEASHQYIALTALATPDDDTALRKLVAKHIRLCAVSAAAFNHADKIEDGSEPL